MKKESLIRKSLAIMYHFTLVVKLWYDIGYSFFMPEYLKFVKSVHRDCYCKTLYMSKKYDLLTDMMDDYRAIDMPNATPKFYEDDIRIYNIMCDKNHSL